MRYTLLVAALAASVATPAFAQAVTPPAPTATDTATALAKGVVLQSHQLTKNTDLDFGVVTTDGLTTGTVKVDADSTGARSATGGVLPLPSTYQAANFSGLAAPDETVALTVTPPVGNVLISSTNATDKITVNSLDLDSGGLTGSRVADANGQFEVWVGGTFGLGATQNAGVYSAQFKLTADYQ
jgi:hypothetical protein